MKIVKNTSMQGHYVLFNTPEGTKQKFIGPKKTITVPNSWGGKVVDNFIRRRMLKVTVTEDVPKSTTTLPAPQKRTRKTYPKESN